MIDESIPNAFYVRVFWSSLASLHTRGWCLMTTGGLLNQESTLMGHQYNHFVSFEPRLRIRVMAARKHS
jgi:hypothetical protein